MGGLGAHVDGAEVGEAAAGQHPSDDVGQGRSERLGRGVPHQGGEEGCVGAPDAGRRWFVRSKETDIAILFAYTGKDRSWYAPALTSFRAAFLGLFVPFPGEASLSPRNVDDGANEERQRNGRMEVFIRTCRHGRVR